MSEQPTEAKHTPLPWFVGGDGADIFAGGEAPNYAGARHVADCQPGRPGLLGMESEDAANAQLLVMAPVLLAVCEEAERAIREMHPAPPRDGALHAARMSCVEIIQKARETR